MLPIGAVCGEAQPKNHCYFKPRHMPLHSYVARFVSNPCGEHGWVLMVAKVEDVPIRTEQLAPRHIALHIGRGGLPARATTT